MVAPKVSNSKLYITFGLIPTPESFMCISFAIYNFEVGLNSLFQVLVAPIDALPTFSGIQCG